jgi:hypothetical protein
MKRTSIAALAAAMAATALYATPPAFAGEVNGRGDPIPATDVAASLCAFSGQNDNPAGSPGNPPGRVQSFGALLKFLSALFGFKLTPFDEQVPNYPGVGCNPNSGGE